MNTTPPMRPPSAFALLSALGLFLLTLTVAGCHRAPNTAPDASVTPTLRLYVISTAAGALEPCGCTKDQLGGVQHAAALLRAESKEAPHALVVGAGPMLFLDPKSEDGRATQDLWKAEALASSFRDMGLVAWAPGKNDWAEGATELKRLSALSHADLLAGNLHGDTAGAKATRLVDINGVRVGLAGVSEPKGPLGGPKGVEIGDAKAALESALANLKKEGATIFVALVAADRGKALRLADQVPGFSAFVVGKAFDQGDGNDPTTPPTMVGDTVVVEAPNHLQGVVLLDLFVRGPLPFKDGSGIGQLEAKKSLEGRISDLKQRITTAQVSGALATDIAARKTDLAGLQRQLAAIPSAHAPSSGSFFRYRAEAVGDKVGAVPEVTARIDDYYRRVNDHNKVAFKDRLPPRAAPGDATYIGAEECATCHEEAYDFWKTTPHAKAYATLSTEHKEFNLDCVGCHVTGYEKPGGSTVTHVAGLMDVQCEVCHGPGSLHVKDPGSGARLVKSPPKTLCAPMCHHPPHVQEGWDVNAAWKVILGKGHGA